MKKPKKLLELGTAIGYSAILMSEYLDEGGTIVTIENYDKRIPVARENIKKAGKEKIITLIEGDALIAPFRAVPSLGANVADQIVAARAESDFLSKEDLGKRGSVSKTVMEYLDTNNVVSHLPDENQLSLFDF